MGQGARNWTGASIVPILESVPALRLALRVGRYSQHETKKFYLMLKIVVYAGRRFATPSITQI